MRDESQFEDVMSNRAWRSWHVERDRTQPAYNHAQYLEERREVMRGLAGYLDRARASRLASSAFQALLGPLFSPSRISWRNRSSLAVQMPSAFVELSVNAAGEVVPGPTRPAAAARG